MTIADPAPTRIPDSAYDQIVAALEAETERHDQAEALKLAKVRGKAAAP